MIEYFGPGAETLSATQKVTITNMGAELGVSTSVFVYDDSMNAYLKSVGRIKDAEQAESMAEIFTQDEICVNDPEKVFDEIVEINLGEIKTGSCRPLQPGQNNKS